MSRNVILFALLWAFGQVAMAGVPEARSLWASADYRHAFAETAEPAAAGNAEAQFMLGEAYRLGRSVEPNQIIADEWYVLAAKQGHLQAATELALSYASQRDWSNAVPWLSYAASREEPRAMAALALLYLNGNGVARDEPAAISLLTQAAEKGAPGAGALLRQMGSPEPVVLATVQASLPAAAPPHHMTLRAAEPQVAQTIVPKLPHTASASLRMTAHYRVQAGAFGTSARAERAWARLSRVAPTLQAIRHVVVRSGNVYRLLMIASSAPRAHAIYASLTRASWPSFICSNRLRIA